MYCIELLTRSTKIFLILSMKYKKPYWGSFNAQNIRINEFQFLKVLIAESHSITALELPALCAHLKYL